jgi:hypothetical protein
LPIDAARLESGDYRARFVFIPPGTGAVRDTLVSAFQLVVHAR